MYNDIYLYSGAHEYRADCICSFCINKRGLVQSLKNLGFNVYVGKFNIDWSYFYPAQNHFDYAIMYQNKIFGGFMFEMSKFPQKVIECAEEYFDYIICSSQFLRGVWGNSGVKEEK